MEKRKLRIGLFQSNIHWEDKQYNYERLEKILQEPSAQNVDCVFLPEMSFTGFSMNVQSVAENDEATIRIMSDYAKKHHVVLGFGWTGCRTDQIFENHYTIVDDEGKVLSDYVKSHPFFSEQGIFTAGDSLTYCQVKGVGTANVICYDLRFPELFRNMDPGAHMVLVPAQWPASRREHWKTLLKARAIENQVYIIGINGVGSIGGVDYAGDSCVIDPDGNLIFEAPSEEGLYIVEFFDETEEYRKKFPVLKDKRNQFYAGLYNARE